ncbi:MAG: hypothetical protein K6B41_15160 [Butyrivibrio sp.]|nr:hypothetical protein [Butyrivibrio sp.]
MELKVGDKVIILDYNGKPQVPHVVAEIEEIISKTRVRLYLPDKGGCYESPKRLGLISEEQYKEDLEKVHERERPVPKDLQLNIQKFAGQHHRLKKDIYKNYTLDKQYISVIHAYAGRVAMYGQENISEEFMLKYIEALEGIKRTRKFFHDMDPKIPLEK